MRKRIQVALAAAVVMLFALPLCVQAATGSKATGAQLPDYSKVVEITVGDTGASGFDSSLRDALNEAEDHASTSTQYKIIIKPGTYNMSWSVKLPSNIHLVATGAVINRVGPNVLSVESGRSYSNIVIEGGTWQISKKDTRYLKSSMFRFTHVKNLIIKDAVIDARGRRSQHIVELGDIDGLTISGCTLTGNTVYGDVQPKEALQLDVCTSQAIPNLLPYNGKGCHNAIIENNVFSNVARGLGSHNFKKGVEKNPYTNITVRNNTFKKMKGEAIFVTWWKNCTIEKNTITNARRAGISIDNSSYLSVRNNTIRKVKAYTGARKKTYGKTVAGVMLRLANRNSIRNNRVYSTKGKAVYVAGGCKKNTVKGNKKK